MDILILDQDLDLGAILEKKRYVAGCARPSLLREGLIHLAVALLAGLVLQVHPGLREVAETLLGAPVNRR